MGRGAAVGITSAALATRRQCHVCPVERRTGLHLCKAGAARAPAGRHLALELVQLQLKGQDLGRGRKKLESGEDRTWPWEGDLPGEGS